MGADRSIAVAGLAALLVVSGLVGCGDEASVNGSGGSVGDAVVAAPAGSTGSSSSEASVDAETYFADVVTFEGPSKRDAMFDVVAELLGPTDDAAAVVSRISPVPDVVTPPGAELVYAEFNAGGTTFTLGVPAEVEELVELYRDDIATLGWEPQDVLQENSMRFEEPTTWETLQVGVGEYGAEPLPVTASVAYWGSAVSGGDLHLQTYQLDRLTGWEFAVPQGAERTEGQLGVGQAGPGWVADVWVTTRYSFPGRSLAEVAADLELAASQAGLEVVEGEADGVAASLLASGEVRLAEPSASWPDATLVLVAGEPDGGDTFVRYRALATFDPGER
jgi:hypothetical protein